MSHKNYKKPTVSQIDDLRIMFYHYPSSHSSRYSPSFLGLNNPMVYVLDPTLENTGTHAAEAHEGRTTNARLNDNDNVHASYRAANVYIEDGKDKYSISFDVPGVKIQDVKLHVKDSVLFVTAERKAGGKIIAKLSQQFALDENLIDPSALSASLSDGVLTITAPKKEEPVPIRVPITVSDPVGVDANGLFLSLDVPGVKAADMKIEFHKGKISLAGERASVNAHGKRQVMSKVNRNFQIKENLLDTNKIQAFLLDGVLTITAPPKPPTPAKLIEIPTSSSVPVTTDSVEETEKHASESVVVETVTQDDEQ